MPRNIIAVFVAGCVALAGCTRKDPASDPGASAAPTGEPVSRSKTGELLYVKVTGRTGQDLGKPVLVLANRSDRPIASFDLRVYPYGSAGEQLGAPRLVRKKPVRPIQPREIRELEVDLGDLPAGATVEVVVTQILFVDGSEWKAGGGAPEQRPKGG